MLFDSDQTMLNIFNGDFFMKFAAYMYNTECI